MAVISPWTSAQEGSHTHLLGLIYEATKKLNSRGMSFQPDKSIAIFRANPGWPGGDTKAIMLLLDSSIWVLSCQVCPGDLLIKFVGNGGGEGKKGNEFQDLISSGDLELSTRSKCSMKHSITWENRSYMYCGQTHGVV